MKLAQHLQQMLRNWGKFRRHDDSYAATRSALWPAIIAAVVNQVQQGRIVWIVSHHNQHFEHLQKLLHEANMDYEIMMPPLHHDQLTPHGWLNHENVKLVLAPLIIEFEGPSQPPSDRTTDRTLAMFVVDRSDTIEHDDVIEQFCRRIPARVELGYYLSLDDDLLKSVVDPTSLTILEQLGMGDHDLITSNMIARRLNRKLRKNSSP